MDIHKNATDFINNNSDEAASMIPSDIVSDVEVEKEALSSFPFISGLSDDYKQDIMEFMELEVDLGVLKKPISEENIFWEDSN